VPNATAAMLCEKIVGKLLRLSRAGEFARNDTPHARESNEAWVILWMALAD